MNDKVKRTGIVVLVLLVLVLGGIVAYSYAVKPLTTGYATKNYNQGANDVLNALLTQIQTQGYIQIPVNDEQSLFLHPFQPEVTQPTVQPTKEVVQVDESSLENS
tara:strand:- start:167 stop:481 length:315 start_codon:yes stop_codon:yes gene_type:complete